MTELFIRYKKLNISLVFIIQSYFVVQENIRLNSTHYFIMKIPEKQALQKIATNHSTEIDFIDFKNFFKECTTKPYSFLVNDTTFVSNNPLLIIMNDDKIRDEKLQHENL